MALSADALTTLAVVADELDVDLGDRKVRGRLERYVNAASTLAKQIIGRPLVYNAAAVEKLRGYGGVRIHVKRTPIVSIASVVVDGDTVDASLYSVEDADIGSIFRSGSWPDTAELQRGPSFHKVPGTEEPIIVVTFAGGWVSPAQAGTRTLPEDLEDAVVQLVTARWKSRGKDLRVVGEGFEKSSYTYGGVPVPAEIAGVFDGYARIGSA